MARTEERRVRDRARQILIVEDSPSDRRLIHELLAECVDAPQRIEGVATLAAARAALTQFTVDCVLLDLSLPDCTGLEGVAVMAAAAPEVPIVVITGRPADALVYAALAEGADEHLCKQDLSSERLHDALLRACERRRGGERSRAPASVALDAFDAFDSPTVAIDGTGRITGLNRAWKAAADQRGGRSTGTGIGVNYLTVCDQAPTSGATGASEAGDGIRAVLCGTSDRFSVDYRCPEPDQLRWFSLRATPLGELGGGAIVTHLDITSIKDAEEVLHRDPARLHSIFDRSSPIFALLDANGQIRHVSDSTTELLGLERDAIVGLDALRQIDPADRDLSVEAFARVMAVPGTREQVRIQILDRQRRRREIEVVAVNLLDDPSVEAVLVTGSDVTEGRHNQIARRLEARLLQRLPAAVVVTDDRGIVVYWNDRAATVFGYDATEAIGRPITDLDVGAQSGDDAEVVERSLDITERLELEESLAFQALHDALTGLPNRRLFVDHLDNALSRSARRQSIVAVLFVDLDDFKAVDDRLGHFGGDQVLRAVGETLTGVLRDGDTVSVTGSIGIALSRAGVAGETLLRNADAAMYYAKTAGKSTVDLFDDARHSEVRARHRTAVALEAALDAGQVHAQFQPQVDLLSGCLTGFEALARWNDPELGYIAPDDFILVAEEGGLIGRVGELVLAEACAALAHWTRENPERSISVAQLRGRASPRAARTGSSCPPSWVWPTRSGSASSPRGSRTPGNWSC